MQPQSISHYRILEQLGEGGSAVVYRAEDLSLGREVALKILPPEFSDYAGITRFQHEARTASSLNHPNICTIYEVGEHAGRHFLAMEFLTGQVLSRTINGKPLEPYRIVELAVQIADALDAAHSANIVHRDIKPANIFVTDRDQVKLLDFGLAVLLPKQGWTGTGVAASTGGTVPYMSPEQARGEELDHRTDLFSLGSVIYEMATGRRPFTGASAAEVMDAIVNKPPALIRELNPAVSVELERIVDKALEKNRKLRFQTASDVHVDLRRLKRELDSVTTLHARTHAPAATAKGQRSTSSQLRIAALLGGIAAAGGVLIALPTLKNRTTDKPANVPSVEKPAGPIVPADAASVTTRAERTERTERTERVARPPAPAPAPAPAATPPPATHSVSAAKPVEPARAPVVSGAEDLAIARQKIELRLYDQALDTLRHVESENVNRADAVEAGFLIASIHQLRGATDDVIGTYLEVASRHPDDPRAPEALLRLAEATLKSRRRDKDAEARRTLTDVVERYPASSWAPRALLLRGDVEERLNLYERDATLETSVPTALITYREIARRYGSSGAAPAALQKLARIYADTKRYELAAATYEELARRDEDDKADAWFAAGELYEKRVKDPLRAKTAYGRVPVSSPHYGDAQKRLKK